MALDPATEYWITNAGNRAPPNTPGGPVTSPDAYKANGLGWDQGWNATLQGTAQGSQNFLPGGNIWALGSKTAVEQDLRRLYTPMPGESYDAWIARLERNRDGGDVDKLLMWAKSPQARQAFESQFNKKTPEQLEQEKEMADRKAMNADVQGRLMRFAEEMRKLDASDPNVQRIQQMATSGSARLAASRGAAGGGLSAMNTQAAVGGQLGQYNMQRQQMAQQALGQVGNMNLETWRLGQADRNFQTGLDQYNQGLYRAASQLNAKNIAEYNAGPYNTLGNMYALGGRIGGGIFGGYMGAMTGDPIGGASKGADMGYNSAQGKVSMFKPNYSPGM